MAEALNHHYFKNPCVPYISNISVTDTRPHFVAGSNVLTSIKGQLEKRPGHVAFETSPTTFAHPVQRTFGWRLWGGAFFVMVNTVGGGQSVVWKYKIGTDTSFVSIFTSSSAAPFDFVVGNNVVYFGNGTDMQKYDGTTVTKWGIAKPAAAPTASSAGAGSISAFAGGFSYKYAFGNSNTGHIGQISDPSTYTGNFTSLNYTITGSNTSDSQVNQIHVYRTGDGGATWYELPNSPIAYSSGWSLTDSAVNTALNTANQASLPGQNAPPTASRSCVFYQGRVWTAIGDTVYYSVFEETINGIQAESFPINATGNIGNLYTFGQEVTALAVVGSGTPYSALLVYGRSTISMITGNSLATFARNTFGTRMGVDNQANVAGGGTSMLAWLDTTNTAWVTDGYQTLQEIGLPIRTDLASYTQTSTSITFHSDGIRRWLLIADSATSKTSPYDCDLGQWMVPWSIGGTAMGSFETSPGQYTLLRTTNAGTEVGTMSPTTFSDFGSSYAESLTPGLMDMGEGKGPGEVGAVQYLALDRNSIALSDVQVITDDDPTVASGTSVFANEINPPDRVQGSSLISKWYPLQGSGTQVTALRGTFKLVWNAQTSGWILYNVDFVSVREEADTYTGVIA